MDSWDRMQVKPQKEPHCESVTRASSDTEMGVRKLAAENKGESGSGNAGGVYAPVILAKKRTIEFLTGVENTQPIYN